MLKIRKAAFAILPLIVIALCFSGCGKGVVLDENEVIEGNGSAKVTKAGVIYSYEKGCVKKDGADFAEVQNAKDDKLFALGEYLYANTEDGAVQIRISDAKTKKFGAGDILAAKGRWIYYKSDKSQVRGMSLYKIDMKEGREVLLFEGDPTFEGEENDVLKFVTRDGTVYTNELNSDEAETEGETD